MSLHEHLPQDIQDRITADVDEDGYIGTDEEPIIATRFAPLYAIKYNTQARCIEIIGDDELENVAVRIPFELLNRKGVTDEQIVAMFVRKETTT